MRRKRTVVWMAALVCVSATALVGNLMAGDSRLPAPGLEVQDGALVSEMIQDAPRTARLADSYVMESTPNTDVQLQANADKQVSGATENFPVGEGSSAEPRWVRSNTRMPVAWVGTQSAGNVAQEGSRALVFDVSPGAGAPPDTLGGYPMTPFADDTRPTLQDVSDVPSPCPAGGDIVFSIPMSHRKIGDGWMSWSHGYTGDVYYSNGATSVTITLPQPACAFYFYVEPNPFEIIYFTAEGNDGTSSGSFPADGSSGAAYVGIFGEGLESVTISSDDGVTDFAIGEFGLACFCEPVYVACCDEATGACEDSVELLSCIEDGGRWDIDVEFCADLDPPCGSQIGACCCGEENEPGVCEAYECIADMTNSACLAAGEETFWNPDESCDATPPYDCGAPTYCDGSGGCDEFIANVYLPHASGTIDNDSSCTGYGDYTDQVALLLISMSYDITVTNGNYYSSDVTAVWVDWNGDKDWDDDGERVMNVDPGGAVASGSFSVPPTAIPGYTRMRVRIDYANPTPAPCGTTTYGEVEDYSVLISGDVPFGACCDPTIGVCTDDVEATECLPPKQFGMETLCIDAFPDCGLPGACCDDISEEGDCEDGVLQLDCFGTRHVPGTLCADLDPACGDIAFIFVTEPGAGPPPATQCGCPMTAHPLDPRPTLTDVNDVPSPCPLGGNIGFSIPMSHRRIGDGWMSWSHGYTGDVYYSNGAFEVTLTLPPNSCGFYMYVEPNPFTVNTFKMIANGIIESEEFTADGSAGSAYAGVCGAGLQTIRLICTSGVDFAIGEFGSCCFCEPAYGACCDPFTGTCANDIEVMECLPPLQWFWEEQCEELEPLCGDPGCCCFPEEGVPLEPYEEFAILCGGRHLSGVLGDDCTGDAFIGDGLPECGLYTVCDHTVTLWDSYGDGWNGGFIDVYVEGDLLVAGATVASGSGPVSYTFVAGTCDTIETVYTPGGWPYENSYCIYGALGEIGCDGMAGATPTGITVAGSCDAPTGACCLGTDGCTDTTEAGCAGTYLGDCTGCGDGADCDGDGETDVCAIASCTGDPGCDDCNENGIPDSCDIADMTSVDCQPNGIPDECEEDCNENGIADECDIADCGDQFEVDYWCFDCQPDGIPDGCQIGEVDGRPEPNVLLYTEYVAGVDAYKATLDTLGWTYTYTQDPNGLAALINGGGWTHIITNHTNTGASYPWEAALPAYLMANPDVVCIVSDWRAAAGHLGPMGFTATGANNYFSLSAVGGGLFDGFPDAPLVNPGYGIFSLGTGGGLNEATQPAGSGAITRSLLNDCWFFSGPGGDCWADLAIAGQYMTAMLECGAGGGADCNGNLIPDDCDILYCDGSPWCLDCQPDGVPDGCEPDCQPNDIADECDIRDCDPDDPDCQDCNGNEIPDSCDIRDCDPGDLECQDCNENGVPDWCDIEFEFSTDCNENGIPDDCESMDDCNGDGIPDICDPDCNENGKSDVCDMWDCGMYDPDYSCPEGNEYAWCDDCNNNGVLDGWEASATPARGSGDIMYAPANPDDVAFRTAVAALTGGVVDYFDPRTTTPTVDQMLEYGMVYTWANYGYADKVAMGNNLADYVDAGGKVILGQWCLCTAGNCLGGRIMDVAEGYLPCTGSSYGSGSYAGDGTGCFTTDVSAWSSSYRDNVTLVDGAENDGTYTDGTPFFAFGIHPAVAYGAGFLPGYGTGDIPQMIANALSCLGGGAGCPEGAGDCNENCIPDDCDIADCDGSPWCQDCQEDGIPDGCQLEDNDCQPDLIPDDCQLGEADCNDNGIPDECDIRDCGILPPYCEHSISMWDSYGNGSNGCTVDVYVNGDLVVPGLTVASGSGPETAYFDAETGDEIFCDFVCVSWCTEPYYTVYDGEGAELGTAYGGYGEGEGDMTVTGNCPAGARTDSVITIEVMTDDYGNETTWQLAEQGGGVVASGGPYPSYAPTLYTYDVDAAADTCYDFTIMDSWGNGICCSYGTGYYNVYLDGDLVGSGGSFGSSETVSDICTDGGGGGPEGCPPFAWCQDCQPDGIPDGCQLDTVPPAEPCVDPDAVITIDLLTDYWGYETSWTLTEVGVGVVASGSDYASTTAYSIDVDVCSTSCYDFTIDDEWGDGIYSPGGFTIYYEGAVVFDAMGGGFTGDTMTIPGIGAGCAGRDAGLLISQPPNQSNGIFSDCDCDFCGQPQVLAENFIMTETAAITTVRFWGGSYASDHTPANSWNVRFYANAAGVPGSEIASYLDVAGDQVQTGVVLFGVHEWDVTLTLSPALTLDAGTYFVACYADSVGDTDSWFWEVGNRDLVAGIAGQAYGFTCPPTYPYYDAVTDMSFELYVQTGPLANDCNGNCVPDECDPDCNCDGTPDDCEDPPFIPSDPTIECPEDVIVTCPESTDPADTGMATGLDNCGNPSVITYSDEVTPATDPTSIVQYTITRTWVSTDECAELSVECVQTIEVRRQTPSFFIKGGACPAPFNRTSHGVTPMVITGDVDFDVYDIVEESVLLYRADGVGGAVAPSPGSPPGIQFKDIDHPYTGGGGCACSDEHSSDGFMDMALKFRNDDMVDGLGLWDQAPGAILLLVITGELENGCEFIAVDCIRIVPGGGGGGAVLTVRSRHMYQWVQVDPLDMTLDGEGYTDFVRTYESGTFVTLTVPLGEFGERFEGWSIDGVTQRSSVRTLEFTLTDDTTVDVVYGGGSPAGVSTAPEETPATETRPGAGSERPGRELEADPG